MTKFLYRVQESREIVFWADSGAKLVNKIAPSKSPVQQVSEDISIRKGYRRLIAEEYDRLTKRRGV